MDYRGELTSKVPTGVGKTEADSVADKSWQCPLSIMGYETKTPMVLGRLLEFRS